MRYIDAMKIRYVRQEKKKKGDQFVRGAITGLNSGNPEQYEFPELEEYYVYTPKQTYPTNSYCFWWWKRIN